LLTLQKEALSAETLRNEYQNKIALEKLIQEENFLSVVNKAIEITPEESISETPIQLDWFTKFRTNAQDISEDQLQLLWAKILSEEIKQPSSISLRTIDAASKLSKDDISLINYFSGAVTNSVVLFQFFDESYQEEFDFHSEPPIDATPFPLTTTKKDFKDKKAFKSYSFPSNYRTELEELGIIQTRYDEIEPAPLLVQHCEDQGFDFELQSYVLNYPNIFVLGNFQEIIAFSGKITDEACQNGEHLFSYLPLTKLGREILSLTDQQAYSATSKMLINEMQKIGYSQYITLPNEVARSLKNQKNVSLSLFFEKGVFSSDNIDESHFKIDENTFPRISFCKDFPPDPKHHDIWIGHDRNQKVCTKSLLWSASQLVSRIVKTTDL